MSGGSFDYVCYDISRINWDTEEGSKLETALTNLCKSLHMLEWVVSGDWGDEELAETIQLALESPIEDYRGFGEFCTPETFNKLKGVVKHAKHCEGAEYELAKHIYQILKAIHERRI